MARVKLSDVTKKHVKVLLYLVISGVLGWVLASYVANNEALTAIFAPAINMAIYILKQEVDKEGFSQFIKK